MIYLVLGTSNSGKSELAEELAISTKDPVRLYLATMKVCDDEGRERVKRHRKQREGKGFVTIEKLYDLPEAITGFSDLMETTVLLECVSNLVANELFENPERGAGVCLSGSDCELFAAPANDLKGQILTGGSRKETVTGLDEPDIRVGEESALADEIAAQVRKISSMVHNLVIVTGEYDMDGENYDDKTRLYVRLLGMVNDRIKIFADEVYDTSAK